MSKQEHRDVSVRLSLSDYNLIVKAAQKLALSPASYCRMKLVIMVQEDLK